MPTFRGPGGLWNDFKPEELATPQAFRLDPRKVWEWYDWRRTLLKDLTPNPGHIALVKMEKWIRHFFLFTQNIDGLHQKAGREHVEPAMQAALKERSLSPNTVAAYRNELAAQSGKTFTSAAAGLLRGIAATF